MILLSMFTQNYRKKIKFTPGNLPPWFDSKVRRLKIKKARTKAKKFKNAHHWNKFRKTKKCIFEIIAGHTQLVHC